MGAILTDEVPVLEILKPTGYNCPEDLMSKTWGDIKGADLDVEANHAAEIKANGTIVINPTEGKDAMKKVTATVDVNSKMLGWVNDTVTVYTLTAAPALTDKAIVGSATGVSQEAITAVGDEYATITVDATVYTRDDTKDITLQLTY